MDDSSDHKLSFEEFKKGMDDYGCGYSKDECQQLFNKFDKDGSGSISFDEFLEGIRVFHSK
jgi:Ca2+-binding EF-hand superfamily protein